MSAAPPLSLRGDGWTALIELHDSTTSRLTCGRGCIASLLLLLASVASAQDCTEWGAELISVEGSVELSRGSGTVWIGAARGDALCAGDSVRTLGYSRAALRLADDSVLRLDQNTTMRLADEEGGDRSLLDLLRGVIHVISRDPRSLRFSTPFANAGLEGTEFVIAVDEQSTEITVVEGVVSVSGSGDTVSVGPGERGIAVANAQPTVTAASDVQELLRWTLYYGPIVLADGPAADEAPPSDRVNDPQFFVARAARRLMNGNIDEAQSDIARALALDPTSPDALAHQALIASVRNEADEALRLAMSAVAVDPESESANLALSRAQLAAFDLAAARNSLESLVARSPENAIAWATLAEVNLAIGSRADAVNLARRAVELDPGLAHAHTVLGFAELIELEYEQAEASFERAIDLDQAAPLPRLGLGLSLIRRGNLEAGRREVEIAVLMSPNDAIVRSYVAKAYFDERRAPLSLGQLELAKVLDPVEPTAFLYDSLQQQATNRPIPALHDAYEATVRNDQESLYRSRLRLDEDLAVRSAARARTYRDLGFEQLALADGWKSVTGMPGDYSGHRLLADTYSSLPRHQIARVNELFVSQLLQPASLTAIPPQLGNTSFFLSDASGPDSLAHTEYSPLLTRNHWTVQGSGIAAGNDTRGEHITVSGINDRLSYSVGRFDLQTDGFRENNDLETTVGNAFLQFRLSDSTSLLGEIRSTETEKGDLRLMFDRDNFNPDLRQNESIDSVRLGFRHSLSATGQLIGAVQYQEGNIDTVSGTAFSLNGRFDDYALDLQSLQQFGRWHLTSGINLARQSIVDSIKVTIALPFPPFMIDERSTLLQRTEQVSAYAYGNFNWTETLTATVGASLDAIDDRARDRSKINPKLGLQWEPSPGTTIRAAAFRTLQGFLVSKDNIRPRLEPTQVVGFNQFFFGSEGDEATRVGLGIDRQRSSRLYFGAEVSARSFDQNIVVIDPMMGETTTPIDIDETLSRAYAYWTPSSSLAFSTEIQRERIDNNGVVLGDGYDTLRTTRIPFGLRYYRSSGFRAGIETAFVEQSGSFGTLRVGPGGVENVLVPGKDSFWITDAFLGYKLPGRHGELGLYVQNLLDEKFQFQDTDPEHPGIVPERRVAIRFTLSM